MCKIKKILLLLILFLFVPFNTMAANLNVPVNYTTIQTAVDAAVAGDTIMLADGIYTGAGNFNVEVGCDDLTVQSVSGNPNNCIIDCQQYGRAFDIIWCGSISLNGLTIKNADSGAESAGTIRCNSTNLTVSNCIFENNHAGYNGGVVYSYGNDSTDFTNCTFTSNSAYDGGAVYTSSDSTTFTNCTFTSNEASNSGGAFYSDFDYGAKYFTNCTFSSNEANFGGAVYIWTGGPPCILTNCLFTSNIAYSCGGAVISAYSTLDSCKFISNSAPKGGALYIQNTSSNVVNSTFISNSASYGGAVNCSASGGDQQVLFTNCTLTLNQSDIQGGAFWTYTPSIPENPIRLKNCILWGDSSPEGTEIYEKTKPPFITWSNVEGGHTGAGNIDSDPIFVDATNGNVHLPYGSPCVDTGTSDGAPDCDLDENPRPVGTGVDMGAYEAIPTSITISALTASPDSGTSPLNVEFSCTANDSAATITDYNWSFGDGENQTLLTNSTQHTYNTTGEFTVTCTVHNDVGGMVAKQVLVTVSNDPPLANAGPDQIVPGTSVFLDGSASSDPDGSIVSWAWQLEHLNDVANNRNAYGSTPSINNLAYGNYIVTLTVTDNFGAKAEDEMNLSVAASQDCTIHEDQNGAKIIDGPLIIENKGLLIIR